MLLTFLGMLVIMPYCPKVYPDIEKFNVIASKL